MVAGHVVPSRWLQRSKMVQPGHGNNRIQSPELGRQADRAGVRVRAGTAQHRNPLLLGSGKRVFADGTVPTALRLTESVVYPSGTLHLAYETTGVPTYGSLVIEE